MKYFAIILFLLTGMKAAAQEPDLIRQQLELQAALAFQAQSPPQPRAVLYPQVLQHTGAVIDHALPLDYRETGHLQMNGYTIRNIYFQTRPGVYATASLYQPGGKGPFPAVVLMHGHWQDGRRNDLFQSVAQRLVTQGYVCLSMDAWGAGERTTVHGEHEYHGSNLGASLMDLGTSLMGMQLTDNIRAVDLLCSLPYVDTAHIGATGASGGGNQTMWLAAMDERIKAAVPVVSVGTFESYIMNSNCVCELLPGGLCFTEEAGILGMIAPRALKIITAFNDANKAFTPGQMLRTYMGLTPIYGQLQAKDKLGNQLFATGHGYWPEMQEAMLEWFATHLKGVPPRTPLTIAPPAPLPPEKLLTFPPGKRDTLVTTTADYCRQQGQLLRGKMKMTAGKRAALRQLLQLHDAPQLQALTQYGTRNGWDSMAILTSENELLRFRHRAPANNAKDYTIIIGKDTAGIPAGNGVILLDLWGTGSSSSAAATAIDGQLPPFHTLSRSLLWLGQTVMGKWVNDLQLVHHWLDSTKRAKRIHIDAAREAGLAAIFHAALYGGDGDISLHGTPLSYLFDERKNIDHFNMATHIPGILQWGDVSLAAGLSDSNISFSGPVSISGRKISGAELEQYRKEFEQFKKAGTISFR